MRYRSLGRTGWHVSQVGFGAWAIGGDWGNVSESDAIDALQAALDNGVNFIDTADVYGDGRSERLIARVLRGRADRVYVATKAGRRLDPHTAEGYNRANLTRFVDRSLKNLETESIDLLQLHCPPPAVYGMPEVFGVLDDLLRDGKIRHYGVSVETVDEATQALDHPNVQTVQIIFNIFRQRPADAFFALARQHRAGILARVPLASGLLSGKITADRVFPENDHRNYNRHGESFDVGETFAGVDFETGLAAVEELRRLLPQGASMAQFALRWILMSDEVACVIPGAKNALQAAENARAADMPPLSPETMHAVRAIYDARIRPLVHHRW
jgi:aryl-alcohol dehydrogenase-like predicted oxidoreductase